MRDKATSAEYRAIIQRYQTARAAMDAYTEGPQNYDREEDDLGYSFLEDELARASAAVRTVPWLPRLRYLLATRRDQGELAPRPDEETR